MTFIIFCILGTLSGNLFGREFAHSLTALWMVLASYTVELQLAKWRLGGAGS